MPITEIQLREWFTYHAPESDEQVRKYQLIREMAHHFAEVVVANTPVCADQSAAVRKIREAVMTANVAIACKGI